MFFTIPLFSIKIPNQTKSLILQFTKAFFEAPKTFPSYRKNKTQKRQQAIPVLDPTTTNKNKILHKKWLFPEISVFFLQKKKIKLKKISTS